MTKMKGEWLCKEDENLYKLQIESKGHVGYSTGKPASTNTTHPSEIGQWKRLTSLALPDCSESSTDSTKNSTDIPWEDDNAALMSKRKHNPTGIARRLVTYSKLLSHGAAVVCRQLSGEGIEIPTPCQSAIHKAIYTRAAWVKKHLVSTLHLEKWSIHFDSKHIEGFEYQAVVIKNEFKEIKLTALKLKDGKAQTISEGLQDVLEEFNLWGSVVMIVADTTNMNTSKKTGIVVRLQQMFKEKGHPKPKFISCTMC